MRNPAVRLRRALGVLWLADAALQAQPALFGRGMVQAILLPAAQGQPSVLAQMIHLAAHMWAIAPAGWNTAAVVIQAALGLVLWSDSPHLYRPALAVSALWAVAIWAVGEGMGGLLTGTASIVSGTPGSALVYAALALSLLAGGGAGTLHRRLSCLVGAYWTLGTALALSAAERSPAVLSGIGRQMAAIAQPAILSYTLGRTAVWLGHTGAWMTLALVAAFAALAVLWWLPLAGATVAIRLAATLTVLAGLWWYGMDLGVLGGTATDPNTAPVIALAALVASSAVAKRRKVQLAWIARRGPGRRPAATQLPGLSAFQNTVVEHGRPSGNRA